MPTVPHLYLHGLHQDPYSNTIVCAYVYYGSKNNPRTHLNKKIGSFTPNEEDLQAFINHLNTIVLPLLNKGLKGFGYEVMELSFINNAPHPVFMIKREDEAILTKSDFKNIEKAIKTSIQSQQKIAKHSLFDVQKRKTNTVEAEINHYNLRSMR